MRPILLATDGSPSAAEATLEAIELARTFDTGMIALSATHVVAPVYAYHGYAEAVARFQQLEEERIADVLLQTAAAAKAAGVDCETVSASGPPVAEICKTAREHGARMIVVGAHGWGPVRRMLYGSVSTGLLHAAPCPVLVVRHSEVIPDRPDTHAVATKEAS